MSESLLFDVHYGGHTCICVPNTKFLCLTLCQGEVCTDADDVNDDDANDNGQSMIVQGPLVDKPNEPKKNPMEALLYQSKQKRMYATCLAHQCSQFHNLYVIVILSE